MRCVSERLCRAFVAWDALVRGASMRAPDSPPHSTAKASRRWVDAPAHATALAEQRPPAGWPRRSAANSNAAPAELRRHSRQLSSAM